MNIKTASALALGSVVLTLVATALFLWVNNSDTPTVSAQEVVSRACEGTAGLGSYDLISTMKIEEDGVSIEGTMTVKVSVEGKDFQAETTYPDGSRREGIRVDDVDYERPHALGDGWAVSKAKFADVTAYLGHLGSSPACPELTNVTRKEEEELDGVKVTVYTAIDAAGLDKAALEKMDTSFDGERHAKAHKYWIDGSGLMVQYWEDRYTLSQYDGSRALLRFTFTTKISGVGEANVITAPVIPQP